MPRLILLCLLVAGLSGCTRFPKLDAAVGPEAMHAPYPRLAPIGPILNRPATAVPTDPSGGLAGQGAALRARAAKLYNTPVQSD